MNANATALDRPRLADWAAVAAGLAILGIRAYVPLGAVSLAIVYLALTALVLTPSPAETRSSLHPLMVAGAGVAAVWTARWVSGPSLVATGVTGGAVVLDMLAAVGEEALFRRFLYDRLARWGPALAVGVTAVAFAAIHVPAYGWAAAPVDLGAGLLLGWQRWASGTWLAPAATHAFANLLAVLR